MLVYTVVCLSSIHQYVYQVQHHLLHQTTLVLLLTECCTALLYLVAVVLLICWSQLQAIIHSEKTQGHISVLQSTRLAARSEHLVDTFETVTNEIEVAYLCATGIYCQNLLVQVCDLPLASHFLFERRASNAVYQPQLMFSLNNRQCCAILHYSHCTLYKQATASMLLNATEATRLACCTPTLR
jgi:hypothetical protein